MERNCIKCGKSIKPVWEKFNFPVNQEAWGGGVVNEITAGYGSNFDGNTFIIAICDKCIEDN